MTATSTLPTLVEAPFAVGRSTGFAEQATNLVRIARHVGELHAGRQKEDFLETLVAQGMQPDEAQGYWGKLCSPSQFDYKSSKDNTQLAQRLGIAVEDTLLPRNHLLYRLLELHFPDILEFKIIGKYHHGGALGRNDPDRRDVIFTKLPVNRNGEFMKVCRVYMGQEPVYFGHEVARKAKPLCAVVGDVIGLELANLLVEQKMLVPPPSVLALLGEILKKGVAGQTLKLVGAFCPDYSYEETGNPALPYRYTFNGVGSGVGLVAQQFVRVIPPLSRFLARAGIRHEIFLSIGDFEADSEEVCRRVNVSREEFHDRCRASLEAFREAIGSIPVTLEMFGLDRSRGRLRPYAQEATDRMLAGDFGNMSELYPNIRDVVAEVGIQYRTFYGRWYGRDMSTAEVTELVLRQGGEYAALSQIYREDLGENVITVAGDRPQMHLFNSFYGLDVPLCVKRAY